MPLTEDAVVVAQYIQNLIKVDVGLGFKDVLYGDSPRIPDTPYCTVEVGRKRRSREGALNQMLIEMEVLIVVYVGRMGDPSTTKLQAEQKAEAVETLLHSTGNLTLGGLVIDGYVNTVEYGVSAFPNRVFLRAARLTWYGRSRERIG